MLNNSYDLSVVCFTFYLITLFHSTFDISIPYMRFDNIFGIKRNKKEIFKLGSGLYNILRVVKIKKIINILKSFN